MHWPPGASRATRKNERLPPPCSFYDCRASAFKSHEGGFVFQEQIFGSVIDAVCSAREDICMSTSVYATPRRSPRVFRRVRIQAAGRSHDGRKFREMCETVV